MSEEKELSMEQFGQVSSGWKYQSEEFQIRL